MSRRLPIVHEVVIAFALLAAAAFERRHDGVQLDLLLVALLAAPLHARRVLGGAHPRLLASLLEVVSIAATFLHFPPPAWSLTAASAATLTDVLGRDEQPAVGSRLRALAALPVGAAILALVFRATHHPHYFELWQYKTALMVPPLVVVTLEVLLVRAPRSSATALRWLALGCVFAGSTTRVAAPGDLLSLVVLAFDSATRLFAHGAADPVTARRRAIFRLGTLVAIFVLVWGFGELAFHLVPNRYRDMNIPSMKTWHEPGSTYVYEGAVLGPKQAKPIPVRWNARSYHDVDHELARPAGTTRVLVLGDSYIEGVQVPLDDLFHRKLERGLAARSEQPVEAIALSWSGWGQVQELETLEKEGFAYDPALVLVEFLPGNDVRNNLDALERLANDQSRPDPLYLEALREGYAFTSFLLDHAILTLRNLRGDRDAVDLDAFRLEPKHAPALWTEAWTKTEALLAEIDRVTKAHGARFVVVIFTSTPEIATILENPPPGEGGLDLRRVARRVSEICERHAIPCLDLGPRFAKLSAEERGRLEVKGDGHFASFGHERAAAETVHFLAEETTLFREALERQGRLK